MKKENQLLFVLAAIQFVHILDFMIIMPLGAQFMEIFQITPQQFSLIVSCYAISAFVMSLMSSMFIDRFDRKKALLYPFIGFALGTLACALAADYYFFLLARSITGIFGGLLSALVLSIVADAIPLERRSSAMGIVMTAFSVASVVGVPAGIFLAAEYSWRMPFIVVGSLSLILAFVVFWLVPSMTQHLENNTEKKDPLKIIKEVAGDANQRRALLFSMILMLGHFTVVPFIAPYMQLNIGFTDHQVTYIYLAGGLLTVFLLPFFGRLSDRIGNAKVFTGASLLALFSIFALTNVGAVSIIVALCVTSSYFVVSSGRTVPATTMVTAVVKPASRGGFMSLRSSANQLALGLASIISGAIVVKGQDGILVNYNYVGYFAIIMSVCAVFLAWRLRVVE